MRRNVRLNLLFIFILSIVSLKAQSVAAADEAHIKHRLMLVEYNHGNSIIMEVSPEGKQEWQYPVGGLCVMFQPLAGGHIVFAHHDPSGPTGAREIDGDRKTVWDYVAACPESLSCERQPSGDTLVGEEGPCRVVDVDSKGAVVSTLNLTTHEAAPHRQLRCFHKLENGHILSCHEGDATVRETDADGKVVWEYSGAKDVFEALRLSSGNTLIACGTDKRLVEVSPDKKIVWELKSDEVPELNFAWITSLQVLKNGNYLIGNFLRGQEGKGAHAFEVTRDKKIVWTFADHKMVSSLTMVRVIDDK